MNLPGPAGPGQFQAVKPRKILARLFSLLRAFVWYPLYMNQTLSACQLDTACLAPQPERIRNRFTHLVPATDAGHPAMEVSSYA